MTQAEVAIALDGTFETPEAEGRLESLTHEYPVEGEELRMDGKLDLEFRQAHVGDSLRVKIASPSTTIEGPEGVALASDSSVFSAPTFASLIAGAATLVLIAPIAAVFLVGHVRYRRMSTEAHLNRAEEAFVEHRPRVARRHARWVRRKGEEAAEGWFIHAASLAQEKKYERLAREVPPLLDEIPMPTRASLAFLLVIAHQKLDDLDEARRFAKIAAEDPTVRHRILIDGMFADVRDALAPAEPGPSVPGYA